MELIKQYGCAMIPSNMRMIVHRQEQQILQANKIWYTTFHNLNESAVYKSLLLSMGEQRVRHITTHLRVSFTTKINVRTAGYARHDDRPAPLHIYHKINTKRDGGGTV